MGDIFVTSDLHLEHIKSFLYEPRGFKSIEEHDEEIVRRWNEVVNPEDEVYFLGDIALCHGDDRARKRAAAHINQLNGTIYWIRGNHDGDAQIEYMLNNCNNLKYIGCAEVFKYHKYNLYLSHYPSLTSNYDEGMPLKTKVISVCGHTHTKDPFADWDKGIIFHAELDTNNCYPWKLDDIIEKCKEKYNENRV